MSFIRRTSRAAEAVPPPGTQERRSVCRYSVVQKEAWIGWWEGQAFQNTGATIIDISLRGALLTVESFPPKDQPLWFCPPGVAASDEWIEVKLIGVKKKLFGPREVRVAFRKVFPYEIFKAVVYGPDAFKAVEPPAWVPEDASERDWW
jgi:hypothetical protein